MTQAPRAFSRRLGGRTGKKNPRLATTFIQNATRDVVLRICQNVYAYIAMYIDHSKPKEHLGYIIDRTGFEKFQSVVLAKIESDPPLQVVKPENPGYVYPRRE